MKREQRLELIKKIIALQEVSTQEELQDLLRAEGVEITQASLSRDIRNLQIVKKRSNDKVFYALLNENAQDGNAELLSNFARFVIKVARAQFMVVIHTALGEADLLANSLDEAERNDILGTIAGADTLFITCASDEAAANLVKEIENVL